MYDVYSEKKSKMSDDDEAHGKTKDKAFRKSVVCKVYKITKDILCA